MIEDGSLNINKFHFPTGDKAFYQGNYYSDKAPGMTFGAIPAIVASKLVLDSTRENYKWINNKKNITFSFIFVQQFATIATSGLMTALAALGLYFVVLKMGAGLTAATFGALAYGFATPAWGWATVFFGHASAAACLFLGFVSIIYLRDLPSANRRDISLGFISGALLSWAIVIEYTSAPASAIIAIYGLVIASGWERQRFIRVLLSAFIGACIFILPLLIYKYVIYGNIFSSGYEYTVFFPGMKDGYFGIVAPKLEVLFKLLFSPNKGLFWFSPLLLLVPLAIYRLWIAPKHKGLVVTIVAITLYYFIWNSGYIYWTGGGSLGPRYLTPVLPFLCLSLALLWANCSRISKGILLVFFVVSFLISLASVSASMTYELAPGLNAVMDFAIPKFYNAEQLNTSLVLRLVFPSFKGNSHLDILPLYIIIVSGVSYIFWELKSARKEGSLNP